MTEAFLSDVRALTIRQPWADAVLEPDGKNIENRTAGFPRSWRGTLLIHAGTGWSERGAADPRILDLFGFAPSVDRTAGCILGAVDLVDVHDDVGCCRPWGESEYVEAGGAVRTSLVHLVLDHPRTFDEPIPCRGRLGLWRIPPDLLAYVVDALEVVA